MSRLGEYLKRSGSVESRTVVYPVKRFRISADPVVVFIVIFVVIFVSAYFLRSAKKVYFKGENFENISIIEQKFNSLVEDYKNFRIDNTFLDFIKAVYFGNKGALIEIIAKTSDQKILGVYQSIYGDPKDAVKILSKHYAAEKDPFLLHYFVYALLRLGNIIEAERFVSGNEAVEGQTLVLLASKLEKLGSVKSAQRYYNLSLEKDIPLELKNSIKVKLSLLKSVGVKD